MLGRGFAFTQSCLTLLARLLLQYSYSCAFALQYSYACFCSTTKASLYCSAKASLYQPMHSTLSAGCANIDRNAHTRAGFDFRMLRSCLKAEGLTLPADWVCMDSLQIAKDFDMRGRLGLARNTAGGWQRACACDSARCAAAAVRRGGQLRQRPLPNP